MPLIDVRALTHIYGGLTALDDVELTVDAGEVFALLGPNGAGKSTLLRILAGLHPPTAGTALVLDRDSRRLRPAERARIGYVAEGQALPERMRVGEMERYLAPLYPTWDHDLADRLRKRFRLDSTRRVGRLSRGERMKVALLCALAPRPELLLLDEPLGGLDLRVRDDLLTALLGVANEGMGVVVASHEIGELEPLADRVGILHLGALQLVESLERLRERARRVEVVHASLSGDAAPDPGRLPEAALAPRRAGGRLTFLLLDHTRLEAGELGERFPEAERVELHPVPLAELYLALTDEDPVDESEPADAGVAA